MFSICGFHHKFDLGCFSWYLHESRRNLQNSYVPNKESGPVYPRCPRHAVHYTRCFDTNCPICWLLSTQIKSKSSFQDVSRKKIHVIRRLQWCFIVSHVAISCNFSVSVRSAVFQYAPSFSVSAGGQ